MSEALCQCGHAKNMHTEFMPRNKCHGRDPIKAAYIGCDCTLFDPTPPPTREPIRLTAEERSQMNCDCAQPYGWEDHVDSCFVPAVESILAARLAGGPTLADAWREGWLYARSTPGLAYDNPYRTPESEDD